MPAEIHASEIKWAPPVKFRVAFDGVPPNQAVTVMKSVLRERWPTIQRGGQCVYIIRLTGEIAVQYPNHVSPTIYIGSGAAKGRVLQHTQWLAPLVRNISQLGLEFRVATVVRKNHPTLYQYIEADLLAWFQEHYGTLPWFNKQRERSKEDCYDYTSDAWRGLKSACRNGSGNTFIWAIQPTRNNTFYDTFTAGKAR